MLWFLLFTLVWGHDQRPVPDCEDHTNYLVPYINDTVSDPCGDGDCWTLCDHEKWHEIVYNRSEFNKLHLQEEQKDCIETACTHFYYGYIDLNLLETCATHKCRVMHHRIENARNCSAVLVQTSAMYNRLVVHKNYYDRIVETNRSMIEYNKHDFMYGAQSVIHETHDRINDFELVVDELNRIMEIKDPDTEMETFDKLLQEMHDSHDKTDVLEEHIDVMAHTADETRLFLQHIKYVMNYATSYSNALKLVKEYIDHLHDTVIDQYVFETGTCDPIDVLFDRISDSCTLCDHGVCKFVPWELQCTCDLGWKGITCSEPMTSCDDDPCIHEGACVNEYSSYRCECMNNWVGDFCQIPVNETLGCTVTGAAHPCQQNSTCQTNDHGYSCKCGFGWLGHNCQYSMKDCGQTNPCAYDEATHTFHGQCMFDGNRISCRCEQEEMYGQPFWFGDYCSYEQLECHYDTENYQKGLMQRGAPCSGHGLCTLNRAHKANRPPFTCVCDNGYFGERCEILVDTSNTCLFYGTACLHGSCDSCHSANNCTCVCYDGWEGQLCTEEIDECDPNPCKNNAPCHDQFNDFYCDCSAIPGQFGGKFCAEQVTCAQLPCGDGAITCNDESATTLSDIKCLCHQGWIGDRCEKKRKSLCQSDLCLNGGICVEGLAATFCQCLPGWSGDRCQHPPTFCDDQPCGTTGECILHGNGYLCECLVGWEGSNCNINIDDCADRPCKNSATCVDEINDFTCLCTTGWRGKQCEILISPCDDITCEHNGVCVDTRSQHWTEDTYECMCAHPTCHRLGSNGQPILAKNTTTIVVVKTKQSINLLIIAAVGALLFLIITCLCWYYSTQRKKRVNYKPLHMASLI